MLRVFKCLPATTALLVYAATVPLALSSDHLSGNKADASAAREAEVESITPAEATDATVVTNASEAQSEEQPAAAVTAEKGPTTGADGWVCRKETPTGSHRTIRACRRTADIDANSAEVERTMHRQRHYGNPSVTPEG